MLPRLLAIPVAAGLVAGGTALAQGDSDPYAVPEPHVTSGAVLRLGAASGCLPDRLLKIRFTPPAGAVFGSLEVRVRGRRYARLTGIPRAASTTVRLPRGRSTVGVAGETLGGQRVAVRRVYRTCAPPPPAPPTGSSGDAVPISRGGGED